MEYLPAVYFLVVIAVCSWLFYQVTEKEKLNKIKKIAYWVVIAVLTLSLYPMSAWLGSLSLNGELENASFHGKDGEILYTESRIDQGIAPTDSTSFRMQAVDLKNNKILGKFSEFEPMELLAETDDLLWFYDSDNGLSTRDPLTLKLIQGQQTLMDKNPQLSKGLTQDFYFDKSSGEMLVTTQDGYNFAIDPHSFAASPIERSRLDKLEQMNTVEDGEITIDNQRVEMVGDTRTTIEKDTPNGLVKFFPNADTTFLQGAFLMDYFTKSYVQMDTPKSLVIISKENLDDSFETIVSRVDFQGKVLWQKKLVDPSGDDYILHAHVVGDTLVVVTDYEVIVLDGKDGSEKWRVNF